VFLRHSDIVGWVPGRASSLQKPVPHRQVPFWNKQKTTKATMAKSVSCRKSGHKNVGSMAQLSCYSAVENFNFESFINLMKFFMARF